MSDIGYEKRSASVTPPEGYRLLRLGETVKDGDIKLIGGAWLELDSAVKYVVKLYSIPYARRI
jgi:hypothetical protein